jgi:hypothetical protein
METEMKQIMELFAKERKARKKEIIKLKSKISDQEKKWKDEKRQLE